MRLASVDIGVERRERGGSLAAIGIIARIGIHNGGNKRRKETPTVAVQGRNIVQQLRVELLVGLGHCGELFLRCSELGGCRNIVNAKCTCGEKKKKLQY